MDDAQIVEPEVLPPIEETQSVPEMMYLIIAQPPPFVLCILFFCLGILYAKIVNDAFR